MFQDEEFTAACRELEGPQVEGWEFFTESHDVTIYRLYNEVSLQSNIHVTLAHRTSGIAVCCCKTFLYSPLFQLCADSDIAQCTTALAFANQANSVGYFSSIMLIFSPNCLLIYCSR